MTVLSNPNEQQTHMHADTKAAIIQTHGIHHVSSIVGHAQEDIDFYAGVMGMRLVKKTLNFDDRHGYHFYYGNTDGSTGLTTTFPLLDAVDGRIGGGQVKSIQYAVRPGKLQFWEDRLARFGTLAIELNGLAGKKLRFKDPAGLNLEIIETTKMAGNEWDFAEITKENAILGLESVTLLSRHPEQTLELFTTLLGYKLVDEDSALYKLQVHNDLGGNIYLSKENPKQGNIAVGSVHHVALKVKAEELESWIARLRDAGYHPTEIKNRKYFQSVYFREKGGILIELASFGPGVLIDEPLETLGQELMIPPHYEAYREDILEEMVPVEVREITKMGNYTYRNAYEYQIMQTREALREQMAPLRERERSGQLSETDATKLSELRREFVKAK